MTTCKHKTRPNDKIQSLFVDRLLGGRKKVIVFSISWAKQNLQGRTYTLQKREQIQCAMHFYCLPFTNTECTFTFYFFHSRKVIVSRLAFDAAVVHSSGHDITQIHKFTNIQIYDCQFIRKRKEQK